jgi:hypothetical protein
VKLRQALKILNNEACYTRMAKRYSTYLKAMYRVNRYTFEAYLRAIWHDRKIRKKDGVW